MKEQPKSREQAFKVKDGAITLLQPDGTVTHVADVMPTMSGITAADVLVQNANDYRKSFSRVSGEAKIPDQQKIPLESELMEALAWKDDEIRTLKLKVQELPGGSVPTPDIYAGELNAKRIAAYTRLTKEVNTEIGTIGFIFSAGANWALEIPRGTVPTPSDERWKELFELQKEYTEWLDKANGGCWSMAYAHGYRYSEESIAKGKEYRDRIEKLLKSSTEQGNFGNSGNKG